MTTHLRTAGLSIRAYARETDRSEATVRLAIRDGRLSSALLPGGKIDRAKADAAFARNTRGSKAPSGLTDARRRKLLAQCRLLTDEVAAIEARLVLPADAAAAVRSFSCEVAAAFLRLPGPLASSIQGQPPAEAAGAIYERICCVLGDLSRRGDGPRPKAPVAKVEPTYSKMDRADLATLKATLEARRLEMQRDELNGSVLLIENVSRAVVESASRARGKLLGIHVRIAPYCRHATEAELAALIRSMIEEALAEFACQFVTITELLAAGEATA